MGKAEKYLRFIIPAAVFAAAAAFFGLGYRYHICHQEQFQLFEFTTEYLFSTIAVPGGFSDWAGRFLTQFYIYGWAGSIINAALITAIYLLCTGASYGKTAISRILLILPATAFTVFLTDERSLPGALVAVAVAMAAAVLAKKAKTRKARGLAVILCTPLLYWICGPVAILLPLLAAKEIRPAAAAASLILALAMPFAASFLLHQSLRALAFGVHYSRYITIIPTALWIAVGLTALFCNLPGISFRKHTPETVLRIFCLIAVTAVSVWAVNRNADFKKEEMMAYDYLSRNQSWEEIIGQAQKKQPDRPLSVSTLNLALSQTGKMSENMFKFYQNGTAGLFPPFSRVFTTPLSTAEIFWHLGLVNAAQHFTFEAQEAIPDFQKSGRCYRRLAETNLVNGDYAVAAKYLNALSHTLFYRNWAKTASLLLGDEEAIATHPLYGAMRKSRCQEKDSWFKDTAVDSVLTDIVNEQPGNRTAKEYLLAWYLLDRNLDGFVSHFKPDEFNPVPETYQQAYLLHMLENQMALEDAPDFVTGTVTDRFKSFIKALQSRQTNKFISASYGDTYWYYAIYRQ